jgi:phage N-6-adenine-methyltransferase
MADKMEVHFSSNTPEWATPQEFFDALNEEFGFTLDPCSTDENHKCSKYFTAATNGLAQDWANDVVFMNPPYGRTIGVWMKKAYESSVAGATVVCLVPSRTDTKWWHEYAMKGEIRFIKGRLKFGGHQNAAPFPNAVIVFKRDTEEQEAA